MLSPFSESNPAKEQMLLGLWIVHKETNLFYKVKYKPEPLATEEAGEADDRRKRGSSTVGQ